MHHLSIVKQTYFITLGVDRVLELRVMPLHRKPTAIGKKAMVNCPVVIFNSSVNSHISVNLITFISLLIILETNVNIVF